jgi:DNA-binding phage protein
VANPVLREVDMLRIVHPAPAGKDTRLPKKRRSAALCLTPEEAQHLRVAIRNVARAYGGMAVLAEVIGAPVATLHNSLNKRRRPSATMALRVAKAAGMSVESVLSGQLSAAGRCQACGSRIGERRAAS